MSPLDELTRSDKYHLCGNITSIWSKDAGIDFYVYGEYFYARPLLRPLILTGKGRDQLTFVSRKWTPHVISETYEGRYTKATVTSSVYKDTVFYKLSIQGRDYEGSIEVFLEGFMRPFHYFSERLVEKMCSLVELEWESMDRSLLFSYDKKYFVNVYGDFRVDAVSRRKGGLFYRLYMKQKQPFTIKIVVTGGPSRKTAVEESESYYEDPDALIEKRRREVERLFSKVPKVQLNERYKKLYYYCWYVILLNGVEIPWHDRLKHRFTMPSKYLFLHHWLWDSGFHSIVLSNYDVELAKSELLNLFLNQQEDGRIPHEVFLSRKLCKAVWGIDDYVPWTTQPPVLAIAVDRIYEVSRDLEYVKKVLPYLMRYDEWFRNKRDYDRDELISYVDYLESGWDDAVRWDEAIEKYRKDPEKYKAMYGRITMAPVEAIDLNVFIYIQRKTIAKLSRILGNEEDASYYEKLAEKTREGIQRYMWDEDLGLFLDIYEEDHKRIPVKTPASFYPMFAGIATPAQAKKMVEHLLNSKEFWTTFPLPTVSADNPKYDPKGYWRGRSWINPIWFVFNGLKEYGYNEVADMLLEKVLDIMAEGPTCNENYNSATGEPLGTIDFGWSTLILDMILSQSSKS
ncbi:MAG: hypothetical protein DRJ47_02410 [Thermoprotei archaeon]|nr:MAG: hypothetical protein DRJ47_02410 [Thermoprotei archaeon]